MDAPESEYEQDIKRLGKVDVDLPESISAADLLNVVMGIGYGQVMSMEQGNMDAAEEMGKTVLKFVQADTEAYREVVLTLGDAKVVNLPDSLQQEMDVRITDDGTVVDTRDYEEIDIE